MSTIEKLTQTLKEAMRAKDDTRKRTVRLALAAIKNLEIETRKEVDEPAVIAILQKEVKARRETIDGAQLAGREDLIVEAEAEIAILEEFLPQPLTLDELTKLAQDAILETGATSPQEMGKVMQVLIPRVQGRADGKETSQIVRTLLSQ